MNTHLLKAALLCISFALCIVPLKAEAAGNERVYVQQPALSQSAVQLKGGLRKLWIDHVVWTRNYIVSAVAGLEDQEKVLERLLKNQQDIGNAIKPYYGEEAGNKLAELLRDHILIAGKIVGAAKSGNAADVERYNKQWYRNADDIAQFLSGANPNWSEKQVKELLHTHLQLVTDTLIARIKGNWEMDIASFDKGEEHIILLADTLTEGIVKQFPNRFKG